MMCLLGLYFAVSHFSNNKKNYIMLSTSILLGTLSGFILFFAKILYPKALNLKLIRINRYLIVAIAITLFMALMVSLVSLILSSKKSEDSNKTLSLVQSAVNSFSLYFLVTYSSSLAFKMTQEFIFFGETSIGTNTLFRVIGFSLGLILVFLVALSYYNIGKRLSPLNLNLMVFVILSCSTVIYSSRAIMALQRLKILKPTKLVFKIMVFGDNYSVLFLYFILIFGILTGAFLYSDSTTIKGTFKNNAIRRIEKKRLLLNKRWGICIVLFSMMSLTTLAYLSKQIHKEVVLSPPKEYLQDDEFIYIPLDIVNDGHLHRFSFILEDKKDVRFIVVRKGKGSAYGVGLDACDICGEAGYYERKDEVICKKCDVVMNKVTIGLKGGCNPVPFPYKIQNSQIIIEKKDLIKEGHRFKLKSK